MLLRPPYVFNGGSWDHGIRREKFRTPTCSKIQHRRCLPMLWLAQMHVGLEQVGCLIFSHASQIHPWPWYVHNMELLMLLQGHVETY